MPWMGHGQGATSLAERRQNTRMTDRLEQRSGFFAALAGAIVVSVLIIGIVAVAAPGSPGILTSGTAFTVLGITTALLVVTNVVMLLAIRAAIREEKEYVDRHDEAVQAPVARIEGHLASIEERISSVEARVEGNERIIAQATGASRGAAQSSGAWSPQAYHSSSGGVRPPPGRGVEVPPVDDTPSISEAGVIPPKMVAAVEGAGIRTVGQLVAVDGDALALEINVLPHRVYQWQAGARLLQVPGIKRREAEALSHCGIHSVTDLQQATPALIVGRLQRERKRGTTTLDIDEAQAEAWIDAARHRIVA